MPLVSITKPSDNNDKLVILMYLKHIYFRHDILHCIFFFIFICLECLKISILVNNKDLFIIYNDTVRR